MTSRHILLGVTGSVASYKAAELVRLLTEAGHTVDVVMSDSAQQFVSPCLFQALSGNPVYTNLWDQRAERSMAHIQLSRQAEVFLIAPATAQCLFKLANGVSDDLISTLASARSCPLIVAPAMNRHMWENPPNQRHVQQLIADQITFFGPGTGSQACGETGLGRMLEPDEIMERLLAFLAEKKLAGKRVLMTAGPTFEPMDAARGITNLSSGKMGYALARACRNAGASVVLVSGQTGLPCPPEVMRINVITAQQMYDAVLDQIATADIFIGVAAVADYRTSYISPHKLKRTDGVPRIDLVPNPDILATVARLPNPPFCVGFAAESERLLESAEQKRLNKKLPMLVANLISDALGSDNTCATLLDDFGTYELGYLSKDETAQAIVDHLAKRLLPKHTVSPTY